MPKSGWLTRQAQSINKVADKLKEIEKIGCSCDLGNSYICDIHDKLRDLRKMLEEYSVI